MRVRRSLYIVLAGGLVATAAWSLGACSSSQTNNLAPPPRPPDPAQLTLQPIRVTRASWSASASSPAAPAPPPTGRGRRAASGPPMSAELAQPILQNANEAVRACYKGLLALSPQAGGSINTLMRVSPDGS